MKEIKKILFKNYTSFNDCIREDAKDLDVMIPMYNLKEYSDKTSGSLLQYYRDELHDAATLNSHPNQR